MIIEIILFLLFIAVFKYIGIPYYQYRKYLKYGEGQFFPIIGEFSGQMKALEKHNDLEYQYKHLYDQYGTKIRVFVENIPGAVKIKIIDPELLRDFFSKVNDNYVKDMFFVENFARLIGGGIILANGDQWKKYRQIFSPAFHFNYLNNQVEQINSITDKVYSRYVEENRLQKVDAIQVMAEITSKVIISSFFGSTLDHVTCNGKSLTVAVTSILLGIGAQTATLPYVLFGSKFFELGLFKEHREVEKNLQDFKKLLKGVIKEYTEKYQREFKETGVIKSNCVLSIIIKDGNINKISEQELIDNFWTFFIAGTDTTSHLVGMSVYYLTQHQEIYKELQKEIDQNTNTTSKGLLDLPLLNAVLKETLRFYGPANTIFDRKAIKDHTIGDIKIEKGTVVTYTATTFQRNPDIFKDPHTYNPHRWMNGETNNIPNFSFVPFSSGAKNCIGQHLALIEARIMLSKFMKKFGFTCEKDYQLKMTYGLVPYPDPGLQINLKLRN